MLEDLVQDTFPGAIDGAGDQQDQRALRRGSWALQRKEQLELTLRS
jgi:hypothetical protein